MRAAVITLLPKAVFNLPCLMRTCRMPVWAHDAICACAVPGSAPAGSAMQQLRAETAGENDVLCTPGLRLSQYCLIKHCLMRAAVITLLPKAVFNLPCLMGT